MVSIALGSQCVASASKYHGFPCMIAKHSGRMVHFFFALSEAPVVARSARAAKADRRPSEAGSASGRELGGRAEVLPGASPSFCSRLTSPILLLDLRSEASSTTSLGIAGARSWRAAA